MGYHRAGFDVVGVDVKRQRHYPFAFVQGDALAPPVRLAAFDAIHASPPCQTFTRAQHLRNAQGRGTTKRDLLAPTRDLLRSSGVLYVLENVPGAPLESPAVLCGSAFGLRVRRHRGFESNLALMGTACDHQAQGTPVGIYGNMRDTIPGGGHTARDLDDARDAMGVEWMPWSVLVEAIPPAFTEWIGRQLLMALEVRGPAPT
jgi:DNA (cytosine-5)-methyltransferase 1